MNTISSPNMSMPVPVPLVDPGPDWAYNINACLSILDGHTHLPGSGVPITPGAININSDLTFNANNAIDFRSVRFTPQGAPLSLPADLGCLYVSGNDVWYNDMLGNQIQITANGGLSMNLVPVPAQTIPGSNVIDWNLGTVFVQNVTANTVYTFSNSISGQTIVVRLTNTTFTGGFPGGVKWSNGIPPTLTLNATDVFTFINDGLNIYGSVVPNF